MICATRLPLSLHAATFYVTVAGLGGEPEYEQRFAAQAQEIDKLVHAGKPRREGHRRCPARRPPKPRCRARSAPVASEAEAERRVRADADRPRQLRRRTITRSICPGPDLSAHRSWQRCSIAFPATRQLVVNMTSASGGSRAALEKPNRAVITATKSGTEKNATVFARYWVEALRDPAADTDKNETVSALEAFIYAEQKTAQFYETQKRLATEHPMLEDTGQGDGAAQTIARKRRRPGGRAHSRCCASARRKRPPTRPKRKRC